MEEQQQQQQHGEGEGEGEGEGVASHISINDNSDILAEILGRLDGRSLGVAACVCRLWSAVSRAETVWESVCVRNVDTPSASPNSATSSSSSSCGPRTRGVVAALGGYRRLYRTCVGPVLLGRPGSKLSLSLSLSLFSIDCYERLWLSGKETPTATAAATSATASASLMFLTNNAVVDVT